jgi:hypothetical protein
MYLGTDNKNIRIGPLSDALMKCICHEISPGALNIGASLAPTDAVRVCISKDADALV